MDLYIIEGVSNSGKSTLIRLLTGIHSAPKDGIRGKNVVPLVWGNTVRQTLVILSSLNEAAPDRLKTIVKPTGLEGYLDAYEAQHFAEAAIIPLSSFGSDSGEPKASDYSKMMTNGRLGCHRIRRVVTMGNQHGEIAKATGIGEPMCLSLGSALDAVKPIRNYTASLVRKNWGLL